MCVCVCVCVCVSVCLSVYLSDCLSLNTICNVIFQFFIVTLSRYSISMYSLVLSCILLMHLDGCVPTSVLHQCTPPVSTIRVLYSFHMCTPVGLAKVYSKNVFFINVLRNCHNSVITYDTLLRHCTLVLYSSSVLC